MCYIREGECPPTCAIKEKRHLLPVREVQIQGLLETFAMLQGAE